MIRTPVLIGHAAFPNPYYSDTPRPPTRTTRTRRDRPRAGAEAGGGGDLGFGDDVILREGLRTKRRRHSCARGSAVARAAAGDAAAGTCAQAAAQPPRATRGLPCPVSGCAESAPPSEWSNSSIIGEFDHSEDWSNRPVHFRPCRHRATARPTQGGRCACSTPATGLESAPTSAASPEESLPGTRRVRLVRGAGRDVSG